MDDYNSTPDVLRLTTKCLPNRLEMQQRLGIPVAMSIKPFGGYDVPQVSYRAGSELSIIRCDSCKAYLNPFVRFEDRGYHWRCNFCQTNNKTQTWYYSPLGEGGVREDIESRPELIHGTIDIVAPSEYQSRKACCPTYIFVIDCTADLASICSTISRVL